MTSGVYEGTETVAYLGYTVKVGGSDLTVTAPNGEEIATNARIGLSTARALIRKHRYHARCGHNQEA